MSRFFFHIRDDEAFEIDLDGLEYPTLGHAVLDAQVAAREMVAEKVLRGERIDHQRFEIANDQGVVVAIVPFRATLWLK